MTNLNPLEQNFWNSYLQTVPDGTLGPTPRVSASSPGDERNTQKLVHKYLDGRKFAASGLVEAYRKNLQELPKVNDYWIILDEKDTPRCIVRTIRVEFNAFKDVTSEIAIAEGDGDLETWRQIHRDFFEKYLQDFGIVDLEETMIVTEFFEIVFPPEARLRNS